MSRPSSAAPAPRGFELDLLIPAHAVTQTHTHTRRMHREDLRLGRGRHRQADHAGGGDGEDSNDEDAIAAVPRRWRPSGHPELSPSAAAPTLIRPHHPDSSAIAAATSTRHRSAGEKPRSARRTSTKPSRTTTTTTDGREPGAHKTVVSAMVDFLTLREPSSVAFREFARQQKTRRKEEGESSEAAAVATPPGAPFPALHRKMPSYVPKVNSKWDGIPASNSKRPASSRRETHFLRPARRKAADDEDDDHQPRLMAELHADDDDAGPVDAAAFARALSSPPSMQAAELIARTGDASTRRADLEDLDLPEMTCFFPPDEEEGEEGADNASAGNLLSPTWIQRSTDRLTPPSPTASPFPVLESHGTLADIAPWTAVDVAIPPSPPRSAPPTRDAPVKSRRSRGWSALLSRSS